MPNLTRNFTAGKMNKVLDERLVPNGEYIDAMNVRMGSTEMSEIGVIENTKGNLPLTSLRYIDGTQLSVDARCIGAIQDGARETVYWFVHDSNFPVGATGKLDMIVFRANRSSAARAGSLIVGARSGSGSGRVPARTGGSGAGRRGCPGPS